MPKPFDNDGNELDARYQVEPAEGGFDLVVESNGGSTGGQPPRNTDYAKALAQHLRRMGDLDLLLMEVQVASVPAMKLPEPDRRIIPDGYSLPLSLATIASADGLRLAIGRKSAAFGRPSGPGGNPMKRLRLRMQWPAAQGKSISEIENFLLGRSGPEAPTGDAVTLVERVHRARNRIRNANAGNEPPPAGQKQVSQVMGTATRYVRDPEVIAWVLQQAAGLCECCGLPAPFKGSDGQPFLEVHHVRPLGERGPDTTDNAVACCPNCHRQMHYDPDRDRLRDDLIDRVERLKSYPLIV